MEGPLVRTPLVEVLGRLHPPLVHFPIALILTAALLELLALRRAPSDPSRGAPPALVGLGAASAWLAAALGWIHAAAEPPGGSAAETLLLHRWSGVALAVAASATALLQRTASRPGGTRAGYRAALALSAVLVGVAGHFGATLGHGPGYLLGPLAERRGAERAPDAPSGSAAHGSPRMAGDGAVAGAEPTVDFARDVEPILGARCYECHGPRRKKGGLRLDRIDEVLAAPPEKRVIAPGDPGASELQRRIGLPEDDEDHMPSEGEPLTPAQIDTIRRWIAEGARTAAVAPPARDVETAAVRERALSALRARGASADVLAQGSEDVAVGFAAVAPTVTDADLELLAGLEPELAELDLARTRVSDAGLARLAPFTHLVRLELGQTPVGDAGLAHLGALQSLEVLNLVGTGVGDAGLEHLAGLGKLRRLFAWSTRVTDAGRDALERARPGLRVVLDGGTPESR